MLLSAVALSAAMLRDLETACMVQNPRHESRSAACDKQGYLQWEPLARIQEDEMLPEHTRTGHAMLLSHQNMHPFPHHGVEIWSCWVGLGYCIASAIVLKNMCGSCGFVKLGWTARGIQRGIQRYAVKLRILEGSWVSIYLSAPAGSSLRRPQEAHWTSWSLALWIWFSVLSLQRQLSFSAFNFSRSCSLCITSSAQCIPPRSAKSQAKLHPISSKFNANLRKGYTLQALNSMRMHLYGTWGPNF